MKMANDVTQTPHIIDTPHADNMVYDGNVFLRNIRWVCVASIAGNRAVITNAAGRVIWESVAAADDYVEQGPINKVAVGGYKVTVLDAGKLFIEASRHYEHWVF